MIDPQRFADLNVGDMFRLVGKPGRVATSPDTFVKTSPRKARSLTVRRDAAASFKLLGGELVESLGWRPRHASDVTLMQKIVAPLADDETAQRYLFFSARGRLLDVRKEVPLWAQLAINAGDVCSLLTLVVPEGQLELIEEEVVS